MNINGIEIPDELLLEAGWTPPLQEFEYPLYRKSKSGMICAFTDRTTAKIIVTGNGVPPAIVGAVQTNIIEHESDYWTPCEKPKPEPKPLQFDGTPVWAYVSNDPNRYEYGVKVKKKRHVVASDGCDFAAVDGGKSNTESIATSEWQYAWEIPEEVQ